MRLNNYEIKKVLKVVLLVFAFLIGFFSLWYTNNLVDKLATREREKIATWADATRILATSDLEGDVNFLLKIIEANTTIPVILTNSEGVWMVRIASGRAHTQHQTFPRGEWAHTVGRVPHTSKSGFTHTPSCSSSSCSYLSFGVICMCYGPRQSPFSCCVLGPARCSR